VADWIITVVDPTTASIQIAQDIQNLISQIREGKMPATQHLKDSKLIERARKIYREARIKKSFVLLNKIKDSEIENYISQKLKEKGLNSIGIIHEDSSISLSWLKGDPLEGENANRDIMNAVRKLEQVVKEPHGRGR